MDNDELGVEMDIHTACSLGEEDYVKEVLQRASVNVDTKNAHGWTPLMYASCGGHVSVAALLVQAGANKEELNSLNQTPLMLAVRSGSLSLVQLVFKRIVLDRKDYFGKTALYYAVEFNYLDIVRFLLAEGANMNVNCCGTTPLHSAIKSDKCPMTELLLSQGTRQLVSTSRQLATPITSPHQGTIDLKEFLKTLSLEKYWPLFQSHNIDLQKFLKMNETDLKSMGINLLGPRRKMYLAIKAFVNHKEYL